MITLDGIELNRSLYLSDIESAPLVSVTQNRTVTGESVLTVLQLVGGRTFELKTMNNTALQGVWCKSVIDALKVVEQRGESVILVYNDDIHTVVITKCSFEPLYQNEAEGPTKKFTGSITLIEV